MSPVTLAMSHADVVWPPEQELGPPWPDLRPVPAPAPMRDRSDRAWRRAVARLGGGPVAEFCIGAEMGRRRPGAAWWDR
jgi:hypothetical protein